MVPLRAPGATRILRINRAIEDEQVDRIATLHFLDGSKLAFEFAEQTTSATARQVKVADFLSGKHLVIEAEGQVFIFPVTSIKYITLSLPRVTGETRGALPRHAIVAARLRG